MDGNPLVVQGRGAKGADACEAGGRHLYRAEPAARGCLRHNLGALSLHTVAGMGLFNSDEALLRAFSMRPAHTLMVLPEASMSTQWANTPLAARWLWIKETYALSSQSMAGSYTVYIVGGKK